MEERGAMKGEAHGIIAGGVEGGGSSQRATTQLSMQPGGGAPFRF